eukprot:CAMPEP_0201668432 /NCGR_PEP_ID=MMETSP0494-20130426/19425_1 /ASSEMBLY_ACC=CAM_ASM_000839 /TAXON_ID=420259 /ORGANISM="Thalassiosira gravida, Strain GMp14c1" /LENGTH=882 /DNA_ID=CAMNT_0048148805 /DNA_START=272 /DNA_END=2920 /DNA_ORIENTATION=+
MCTPDDNSPKETESSPQEQCIIRGGRTLQGRIQIYGAKNSALPVIIAALMTPSDSGDIHELHNVPDITDVRALLQLLSAMGCQCSVSPENGRVRIDSQYLHSFSSQSNPSHACSDSDTSLREEFDMIAQKIRASVLLLGPMLARFGEVRLPLPGGCAIGARPIDLFLKSLNALGANLIVDEETGCIIGSCKELVGTIFRFERVSVCATEALVMAAVAAKGQTVIHNAAREPDVVELVRFLKTLGARIEGEGSSTITINETLTPLRSANKAFSIRGDRIEAGTFLFAAAATGGDLLVDGIIPNDLGEVLKVLEAMGCEIGTTENSIHLRRVNGLKPVSLRTEPFPGFPTDLQPLLSVCCTQAAGISKIQELIYPSRTGHVSQILKLGGSIELSKVVSKEFQSTRDFNETGGSTMIQIEGPTQLEGTTVGSTDLRCAASLVVAGLVSQGETKVQDLNFLDRGYDNICEKFQLLGADIRRAVVFPSGLHILCDEPLSHRITLRVGGKARYFLSASRTELARGLAWAQGKNLNVFVLGAGSNVVVEDAGFDGMVIQMKDSRIALLEESESDVLLEVGAGHNWDQLVSIAVESGLSGIECLSGIPGTVGASPVQNIGAYGQEVGQSIEAVHVVDRENHRMYRFTKEECAFAYRTSNFKTIWADMFVIVSVEFRLSKKQHLLQGGETSSERVMQRLQTKGEEMTASAIRNTVLELRGEKSMIICDDDPNSQSAGSFFINPIIHEAVYKRVCEKLLVLGIDDSSMPARILPPSNGGGGGGETRVQIPAAWLIENAGFRRGYEHGQFPGVALSSRHCLALITKKSAGSTTTSLLGLADFIHCRVEKLFGVFLHMEPVVLGSSLGGRRSKQCNQKFYLESEWEEDRPHRLA